MTEPTTLLDLQSQVATACQLGNPELSCSAGNYPLANQQTAQRKFTDYLTARFIRETHGKDNLDDDACQKIERKLERKSRKFADREEVQRRDANPEKCGFVVIGFLIGGLISFLFQKALEVLWSWWFKAKATAAALCIGRDVIACGAADDDAEDD